MINRLRTDLLLRVILRVQLRLCEKCWRKRRGHAKWDRTQTVNGDESPADAFRQGDARIELELSNIN